MDPQQPNQTQQPPPPPPPPQYAYAPGYYQPPPERLTWKQKIVLGCVLFTLVVLFALWNSCHAPAATATGSAAQPTGIYPSNPRTIESQRLQAQRELEAAQAAAAAAKARFENGPAAAPSPTTARSGAAAAQNPDAEFWRQIRQEKWKREQEAPYASGVGFVTKQARDEDRETAAAPPAEPENRSRETASASAPKPGAAGLPSDPIPAVADAPPTHVLDEGTILPATLLNQLDGEFSGPVICQISENVYDASGLDLLIPAGSKALGSAQSVNSGNQRRLAVAFHRIVMPDGYSLSLDKVPGLDQIGATALSGQVNRHYLQTFGMAAVVGAISGLAQIGNSASSYSPWYGFREGVSQQTAASSEQILSHYLNRLPTIAIKPGSRVKLILTADISGVPEYRNHTMPANR